MVKGRAEGFDPRGGIPVPLKDTLVARYFSPPAAKPTLLPAGSEIAYVTDVAQKLVGAPDLLGLTPRERAQIANWPAGAVVAPFSVVEASVSSLGQALEKGLVTSEDLVRSYLARIAAYDRSGPTFRAFLSLNPNAVTVARERVGSALWASSGALSTESRSRSRTTSTSWACRRPAARGRCSAPPAADSIHTLPPRCAPAAPSCSAKRISTSFPLVTLASALLVGPSGMPTIRRSALLAPAAAAAVGVAANLVALSFGTDTCNSLSNPAAFASLATIRTTRGLTSRGGVMPLNPLTDAVGPMARSVADLAAVLDVVAGPDPDDDATAGIERKSPGAFAAGLDRSALRGARLGLLRQRFVGVTQEREAALRLEVVAEDLRAQGATVIDVVIPDFDALSAQRAAIPRRSFPPGMPI